MTVWIWIAGISGVAVFLLLVPPLRRYLITAPLLTWFRQASPRISPTEQAALNAGTVWWESELFRGNPKWEQLLSFPRPTLSREEQSFIGGPVEELCRIVDD